MNQTGTFTKQQHNRRNYEKHNPYPVRLGPLKPLLQMEAMEKEISMHAVIIEALQKYFEGK